MAKLGVALKVQSLHAKPVGVVGSSAHDPRTQLPAVYAFSLCTADEYLSEFAFSRCDTNTDQKQQWGGFISAYESPSWSIMERGLDRTSSQEPGAGSVPQDVCVVTGGAVLLAAR